MKWFRLYADIVYDPKVQRLSPGLFRFWIHVLCVSALTDGEVLTVDKLAFRVRLRSDRCQQYVSALTDIGLLDASADGIKPHNWDVRQWKVDTNVERQRRFRERQRNVTVTPPEADSRIQKQKQIQNTEAEADISTAAFKSFEDCIGSLSAYMARKLEEDVTEFGETCVVHCLEEAAANNARNLKYAESIMHRHQREGCYDNGREADDYPTEEEVRQRVTWLAETRRQAV